MVYYTDLSTDYVGMRASAQDEPVVSHECHQVTWFDKSRKGGLAVVRVIGDAIQIIVLLFDWQDRRLEWIEP